MQYEIDVQTLTDAILFAAQGSTHPRFINPAQVQETAGLIAKTMSDATFPIPCENGTVADLEKIAHIHDLSLCDIRMIKLSVMFWARTSSPNTWAFSAGKKNKLLINCARAADQVVSVQGVA